MTYANAVKYINHLPDGDANAERAHKVLESILQTERQMKVVHVMGKYGKNSSHRMLSSILREGGYTVGGYSPSHALEPRDAITVNGRMIGYDDFARIIGSLRSAYEGIDTPLPPSRREALCLAAIVYFYESGCDVSIFEKGLDRTDAANITKAPAVSVISAIIDPSEDEYSFIDTFRRECAETVSATQSKAIYSLISERCVDTGSRLTVPLYSELEISKINLFKTAFTYRGKEYSIRSFSPCQTINAITVIEAAAALTRVGIAITDESIKAGLERAQLPHKCEALSLQPAVITADVGDSVRLDTFTASLAQVKDDFDGKIIFATDPECQFDTEHILRALNLGDTDRVSFSEIPEGLTPARRRKYIFSLVSPLLSEEYGRNAVVFLGDAAFVRAVSDAVRDGLGRI